MQKVNSRRQRGRMVRGVPAATREALRTRMRGLGVRREEVSAGLGIPLNTLASLLIGRQKSYSVLGYDRWVEHVSTFLDEYERALTVVRPHVDAALAALQAEQLPIPAALASLTATPRRRRSSSSRAAPAPSTALPTSAVSIIATGGATSITQSPQASHTAQEASDAYALSLA